MSAPAPLPIPSASVILLREAPLEVLMMRRSDTASFVPSAWVFPGGAIDDHDHEVARAIGDASDVAAARIAAIRELFEEAGVWLGKPLRDPEGVRAALLAGGTPDDLFTDAIRDSELVLTSRWITPAGVPKRFDTWFFLAAAPVGCTLDVHAAEGEELRWIAPSEALALNRDGAFAMVFPTVKNLQAIASFDSIARLLEERRSAVVEPVQPVLVNGKPTLP